MPWLSRELTGSIDRALDRRAFGLLTCTSGAVRANDVCRTGNTLAVVLPKRVRRSRQPLPVSGTACLYSERTGVRAGQEATPSVVRILVVSCARFLSFVLLLIS